MIEPALFEALLEELADQDLYRTVLARMSERSRAIEVDIDAIGSQTPRQAQIPPPVCAKRVD